MPADALADANKALELGSNLHKVHFRKGQAAFNLDQYREAKASFSRAAELGNKNCSLWLRKCDAELRLMEKGSS